MWQLLSTNAYGAVLVVEPLASVTELLADAVVVVVVVVAVGVKGANSAAAGWNRAVNMGKE
jgi:hypothetical protein